MPISFDQACHHHKEHTKLTHWRAHIIGKNSEIKGRCFFQFFRTLSNFLFQFIPPPFFFQNIALLERESYQKEREIRWNNRGSCKEIRQVSKRLPYLQSWPYVSNTSIDYSQVSQNTSQLWNSIGFALKIWILWGRITWIYWQMMANKQLRCLDPTVFVLNMNVDPIIVYHVITNTSEMLVFSNPKSTFYPNKL